MRTLIRGGTVVSSSEMVRADVLVEDGRHVGRPGEGRYLPRGPNTLALPPTRSADG